MKTDLKIGVAVGVIVVVAAMIYVVERSNKPAPLPAPPIQKSVEPAPGPAMPALGGGQTATPGLAPTTPGVVTPPAGSPAAHTVVTPPPAVAPMVRPLAPEEPARPEKRYHVVQKGESLSSIAEQYYGNGKFWKVIQQANQQAVPSPEKLRVGAKLRIPYPEEITNPPKP